MCVCVCVCVFVNLFALSVCIIVLACKYICESVSEYLSV